MFRGNKPNRLFHVNFVFQDGGLGDCIARLPALEFVIKHHPDVIPHIWIPDFFYDIAKRSLSADRRVNLKKFSERDKFKKDFPGRTTASKDHTNLSYHMTDHAFNVLVNKQVEDKYKDYLPVNVDNVDVSKFNLPEKYVVIATGYTSPTREFLPGTINAIIDYVMFMGYTPVFLGKRETDNGFNYKIKGTFKEEIHFDKGINLIDQTSILETTKILYGAKTTIGVDNGLLHLAATHPTNHVVAGFTSVDPLHREPYRSGGIRGFNFHSVVPPTSLECRGCQSHYVFAFTHPTFTRCYYDISAEGEQIQCLALLKPELFIEKLEKIL